MTAHQFSRELVGIREIPGADHAAAFDAAIRGEHVRTHEQSRATYSGELIEREAGSVVLVVDGAQYGRDDVLPWGMTAAEFAAPEAYNGNPLAVRFCRGAVVPE